MHTPDLMSLNQAARLIPGRRAGKPAHVNTLFRWCLQGVRGVKLRSVLIGGTRYTSRRWLDEFLASLNRVGGLTRSEPHPLEVLQEIGEFSTSSRKCGHTTGR